MALPTGAEQWPPHELGEEIERVRRLAAWYGGDKRVLLPYSAAAAGAGGSPPGMVARWLLGRRPGGAISGEMGGWGEPDPLHMPVAADIARTSADLLFAETPVFSAPSDAAQARLDALGENLGLDAGLLEAAELAAALSGIYWRVGFDVAVAPDRPVLAWVQPDNAIPEWSYGELRAVTFVRRLEPLLQDRRVWRHLERYSVVPTGSGPAAQIEHGLFAGSAEEGSPLGVPMPLTEHPDTAPIAESLTVDNLMLFPGVPMLAGYVPNMRPNRARRGSPLGRADIEQLDDALRGIDDVWTSWMRDLRLAKARIIVPDEYLRVNGPGEGATFDVDRSVYTPLRMMQPDGGAKATDMIQLIQFAIRTAEHGDTLRALIQQAIGSAGYSLWTFGMADPGAPAATATEVEARERLSNRTREKKARYWSPALRGMWSAVLALDYYLRFPGAVRLAPGEVVGVELRRESDREPQAMAQTLSLLAQAEAASTRTKVEALHPEWTPEQVTKEVALIRAEAGLPAADPLAVGPVTPADLSAAGVGAGG